MKDKSPVDDILEAQFKALDPGEPPRGEGGRFIAGPPNPPFKDSEIARQAALRRWSLSEEAAQRGMMAAVEEKGLQVASGEDAWSEVIKARTKSALRGGKAGFQDAQLVGRATGLLEDKRSVDIRSVNVSVGVDEIDFVLSVMTRKYPDDADRALREALLYRKDPQAWLKEN